MGRTFSLKYAFIEILVIGLALAAWRFTRQLPFPLSVLGLMTIMLTMPAAVAGLFGPRGMRGGFYFSLVFFGMLAMSIVVGIVLAVLSG